MFAGDGARGTPSSQRGGHPAPEQPQEQPFFFDHSPADELRDEVFGGRGRRAFPQEDHMKSQIFQREGGESQRALGPEDVKEQIRQLLAKVHGVAVVDERRWAEAAVERNGWNWRIQTYNEQMRLVCRDGPTAALLAEKLALCPPGELRHFGVRHGGHAAAVTSFHGHRTKGSPLEENPSLMSPGVFSSFEPNAEQENPRLRGCQGLSNARKDPELQSRRYIASGRDHWDSAQVGSHAERGLAGDMAFCDGLERGIGHGRRHFDRRDRDHFSGAAVYAGQ